jgi:hypothetical protein
VLAFGPVGVEWEELKASAVDRTQDPEMPLVGSQKASGLEPMREHDHGEIRQADVKVGVLLIQPAHDLVLWWFQASNLESATRQIGEERSSRRCP